MTDKTHCTNPARIHLTPAPVSATLFAALAGQVPGTDLAEPLANLIAAGGMYTFTFLASLADQLENPEPDVAAHLRPAAGPAPLHLA